jgi:hypothetical protein
LRREGRFALLGHDLCGRISVLGLERRDGEITRPLTARSGAGISQQYTGPWRGCRKPPTKQKLSSQERKTRAGHEKPFAPVVRGHQRES